MGVYSIGGRVRAAASVRAYERKPGDPVHRPLKVYTLDPTAPASDGQVATVLVPYERLSPGPVGAFFRVAGDEHVDLDDPRILIKGGLDPEPADRRFHQQMVYAIAANTYQLFRSALGRLIAWSFEPGKDGTTRLVLRPHAQGVGANAGYDKSKGEVRLGCFEAPPNVKGRTLPGGQVFTCLSHDIVVHEITHALIDGLRSSFAIASGPDVCGFHEGFSDLIAAMQHFCYPEVLKAQIEQSRNDLAKATLLTGIAQQFADATTGESSLRAIDFSGELRYSESLEEHQMGRVLVSAIFDAYQTVYKRRTDRYVRLATNSTGVLPVGYLPAGLSDVLAEEAKTIAGRFLEISIRALDYCPPVDLELGEFLRAMITVDRDLVPSDPFGYREALIDSFANRGIYPRGVEQLSEDSLAWRSPLREVGVVPELSFSKLSFDGDPSSPANANELERQARAMGAFVTRPELRDEFGLACPSDEITAPRVRSIRTARRAGPNREVLFDLVAEITQRRTVRDPKTGDRVDFLGGSTVIVGPKGEVRYVISKNVMKEDRLRRQIKYQRNSPSRDHQLSAAAGRLL